MKTNFWMVGTFVACTQYIAILISADVVTLLLLHTKGIQFLCATIVKFCQNFLFTHNARQNWSECRLAPRLNSSMRAITNRHDNKSVNRQLKMLLHAYQSAAGHYNTCQSAAETIFKYLSSIMSLVMSVKYPFSTSSPCSAAICSTTV